MKLNEIATNFFEPSITVDIALFIRLMEFSREEVKDDFDIHLLTEHIQEQMLKKEILTMDDYDTIIKDLT